MRGGARRGGGRAWSLGARATRRPRPSTPARHGRPSTAAHPLLHWIESLWAPPGRAPPPTGASPGAAWAHFKGRILALGELEKGAFRPTRVFNFG